MFVKEHLKVSIMRAYPRYSETLIKKELGKDLVCAEIGTFDGENAERMLDNLPIRRIYLVDPYAEYGEHGGDKKSIASARRLAHARLERFGDRVAWVEKKSEDAVADIPDGLDFVYIDGAHDYENVRKDIANYYPKIREGGLLTGHDICWPGVTSAVWEFSFKIQSIVRIGIHYDWIITKSEMARNTNSCDGR
jgi:predicted O-methyltransferase YrrM